MNAGSFEQLGRREETDLCVQKRQLEVQLSEVSDETCDMATATFLASLDDQQASKKAKTFMRAQKDGAADVGSADAGLGSTVHASPTGAGATDRAPAGFGQQLMSRLDTMGPPAAMPQLALGSLLVAAQMASGTACSTRGLRDRNSPLLPATQATLQATTASVVAAEVLAAVTRPVAMHPTLAGWFAGNSGSTDHMAAAAVATPGPAQHQQLVPAPGVLQQVSSVPPALSSPAAAGGQPSSRACGQQAAALGSAAQQPAATADLAPGSPAPPSRCAEATAGKAEANTATVPATPEGAATATPAAAADAPDGGSAAAATATPQAGKVQLPSWLCEPSAELTAGRAICQATLLSTTAALARLSSPRGPMVAAQMAVPSAAFSPNCAWAAAVPAATASPAAAAPGARGQCAVVGSMRSPSLYALGGTCKAFAAGSAAVGAEAIAIGVPAAALADGGIAWGLPTGISVLAPMQLTPLKTSCPAAGPVDSAAGADAGSCSSSPKAAAAGTASAREGAPGILAAAAAKLSRSGLQYEQQEGQEGYLLAGTPQQQPMGSFGGSMSDLTADTASSPADEATSGADAAAVVVHVELKAAKVAGSLTAAVAQKQQGNAACAAAGLHL